ncbi:MAG: hypothetical protein AAGI17_07625 [Planctomycetota bacterium]
MNPLRTALETIRQHLGKLGPTQKLLIGSLGVIALMSLFLVSQYAAQPAMVELTGFSAEERASANSMLRASGIDSRIGQNGELEVPAGQRDVAVAALMESNGLPSDTITLFENLVEKQDWRMSREQNNQQFTFALQNELSRVISKFAGVSSASVIIDAPKEAGLGRASREPTASVTVFTRGGQNLTQDTVDAIARLVAGSRAKLTANNVAVIDGTTGRARQATDDSSARASKYREEARLQEKELQRKLEGLLSYIPGVMVAVTAQPDIRQIQRTQTSYAQPGDGTTAVPLSVDTTEYTAEDASQAAEPGVRANQEASIPTGGASSGVTSNTTDRTEFDTRIGQTVTNEIDPRGRPVFLAASINVPESYVSGLVPPGDDPTAEPDQEAIQRRFEQIEASIVSNIEPHVRAFDENGDPVPGEVRVAMVPVSLDAIAGGSANAGVFTMLTGGGGGGVGSIVETAVVGGLAVVAFGLMLMMVKRSSKELDLPTADELVGVPPALQIDPNMVGEADEGDAALEGIEIDESEIAATKMMQQVSELVRNDPEKTAKLLQRWIQLDN